MNKQINNLIKLNENDLQQIMSGVGDERDGSITDITRVNPVISCTQKNTKHNNYSYKYGV